MKKLFLFGSAVLMAAMLFSCAKKEADKDNKSELTGLAFYDANGQIDQLTIKDNTPQTAVTLKWDKDAFETVPTEGEIEASVDKPDLVEIQNVTAASVVLKAIRKPEANESGEDAVLSVGLKDSKYSPAKLRIRVIPHPVDLELVNSDKWGSFKDASFHLYYGADTYQIFESVIVKYSNGYTDDLLANVEVTAGFEDVCPEMTVNDNLEIVVTSTPNPGVKHTLRLESPLWSDPVLRSVKYYLEGQGVSMQIETTPGTFEELKKNKANNIQANKTYNLKIDVTPEQSYQEVKLEVKGGNGEEISASDYTVSNERDNYSINVKTQREVTLICTSLAAGKYEYKLNAQ